MSREDENPDIIAVHIIATSSEADIIAVHIIEPPAAGFGVYGGCTALRLLPR